MQVPYKITPLGDKNYARNFVGAAQSQMRILENQLAFRDLKQGIRRVRFNSRAWIEAIICFNLKEVKIHCLPAIIKGIGREFEKLPKTYIYVTISDYVTIWDPLTGEVAEDICNNYGQVHDESGNPLVTFPCHKDDLVKWLEGIPDKPTRQVLKDNPEDRRDYLPDNNKDIGNENRVELANKEDPSYECYFGILSPCAFTNTVQNIHVDTDPTWPYTYPREVYDLLEKDTPHSDYITECTCDPKCICDLGDCVKAFYARVAGNLYKANGYYINSKTNTVNYLEPYQPRSKRLYLNSYPSPTYLRPGDPAVDIEYSVLEYSPYLDPVAMKCAAASFSCVDGYGSDDWGLSVNRKTGDTASFSTVLGDLVVNFIPIRDLSGDEESLYDILHDGFGFNGDCFALSLREGVCTTLYKSEVRGELWCCGPGGVSGGTPEHATSNKGWCWTETRDAADLTESESNRFGISWCGSPYNYRNPYQTNNWYRVLLRFYMGGFHTSGHSTMADGIDESICPDQEACDAHPEWNCTVTTWGSTLKEGFSSVQATIELESPEAYFKEIDITKYERPEDYYEDPDGVGFCVDQKYSTLCAFPERSQGYSENNGKCFPFDGTYVLHTLGEAVEELINGHYEDGSNDKLLVYLYERPEEIEEEK